MPAPDLHAPKRARGRVRVAALMDAGAAVFAEKGYDAATMTEIAARASTAIGSMYQFFPSKEALAEALLARYADRLQGAMQDIAARAPSLSPAALADALVAFMLDLRGDRAAAVILVDARGDGAARRTELRDAMRGMLAHVLLSADPALPDRRAAAMAVVVLHLLKAIPVLAQEEEAGGQGLVAEAREALRRYVSPAICDAATEMPISPP